MKKEKNKNKKPLTWNKPSAHEHFHLCALAHFLLSVFSPF